MNHPSLPNSHTTVTYTLEPLRKLGPLALDTSNLPPLLKVTLRELQVSYPGIHHHSITFRADDLFAHPPPHLSVPDPIPVHGLLTRAMFAVYFNGIARPHFVQIQLPNTVTFQYPADAPHLFAWMEKIHLRLLAPVTRTATILLLAFATAVAPVLADGDYDEDDPASDRHHVTCNYLN